MIETNYTKKAFTLKIGGQAGQGIKSAGVLFAKFAARSGYHVYTYTEYPSIIRGGHNVMQINIADEEIRGPSSTTNLLIALNQDTVDLHTASLVADAVLLFDSEKKFDTTKIAPTVSLCGIPMAKLATEAGNKDLLLNTVALGAAAAILGGNLASLNNLIYDEYIDKGEKIAESDKLAAKLGFDFVSQNHASLIKQVLVPKNSLGSAVPTIVLNGCESTALGAIAAGLQFTAIYPMSPISNILHVFAQHQKEFGYVYKQPEDEISAINMAIGASFAGARALTATSGGGFSLMVEGYGLAGITETPLVIIEGMRGGPATGLPTWTSQGDLRFVLHAHQDEFPRIVLAPADAQEAFELTMQAFNLADKYQTPVVLLLDKNICENDQSFLQFDTAQYVATRGKFTTQKTEDYKRYLLADDGISLRSTPGSGNFFIANSDEHDEVGYSSEEQQNRLDQMSKRMQKLVTCAHEDMQKPVLYGPDNADITIVSWGSNKGSILEALKHFNNVNYLHVTWMNPLPVNEITTMLQGAKHIINIEANYTGQFGSLLMEKTGIKITDNLLRYDGRPFFIEDIVQKITEVLAK